MGDGPALERLLKRDRLVTAAGLALLCGFAWLYILTGAGLGMSAWEMTRLALFPAPPGAMDMAGMAAPAGGTAFLLMLAMWWLMMVAMMAPSAAPAILLYATVHRHASTREQEPRLAPTGAFAAGYALAWLGFSVVAAGLHGLLESRGLVSMTTMSSASAGLSGGILVAAGLYQLSPLKNACLTRCRTPASFLARHWRPGRLGALRLGVLHGAWCVGCCWMLMALLFVGGVMNLVWIAALTLLVLAEKLLPRGRWVGRAAGALLIAWGVVLFLRA